MLTFSVTDPHFNDKTIALQALYKVIDPELFINVVDLGLIYALEFEEAKLNVTMTLSTPHCPMGEAITNGVQNALEICFPEREVKVDLTFDPAWSFELLSEEGKEQLGF